MPNFSVEKTPLKERIMAVYCNKGVYIGLEKKFINFTTHKILCIHDKCIRCIAGNNEYIGCCSYDGTATVFTTDEKLRDKIEGPETEIKGIAFHDGFIAITTRGKTTWILEDFEISKILEDHTQDIKGCTFHNSRLYTWSYDNTIKVYDLFDVDHSWELAQSVDLEHIVWSVVFFGEFLCAALHNGCIAVMKVQGSLWVLERTMHVSLTPVYSLTVIDSLYLGVVCNRNTLLILDRSFDKIAEITDLNSGCDVLCCCFGSDGMSKFVICGSEDGTLAKVVIEG